MAMLKYFRFSAAVLLLTVDAAPVTVRQGVIRRQLQPHTQQSQQSMSTGADGDVVTAQPTAAAVSSEIQAEVNDQGDFSYMQKSVSGGDIGRQPDYGDGDGDDSGPCSTNLAFTGPSVKTTCKTLAQCQTSCIADSTCNGFNYFRQKGGCRLHSGAYTLKTTDWATIAGGTTGEKYSTSCTAPVDYSSPQCNECPDTSPCRKTYCGVNEKVVDRQCTACPGGSTSTGGDDESGSDTSCTFAPTPAPAATTLAPAEACSTKLVFRGDKKPKTTCKTLAQCQASCIADSTCTGFNYWPKKGGCRLHTGAFTAEEKGWTTIAGGTSSEKFSTACTAPDDDSTPLCSFCPTTTPCRP